VHCDYDNANQTKTSSINTRSKFHKHNLLSHWWWKFAQAQNCSNCKQLTEREWSITWGEICNPNGQDKSTSTKIPEANEEWIFHHDQSTDNLQKPKILTTAWILTGIEWSIMGWKICNPNEQDTLNEHQNCFNKRGVNFPSRFKTLTIGTSIDEGPNFPSHKADFFSDTKLFEKLAGVGRP